MPTRGLFVAIVILMSMVLAACGGEDETPAATSASSAQTATSTIAAGASTAAATPQATEASDGTPTSGEIEITHAQGTTTVPVNPETVAVFDYSVLDTLDQLGIPVAGVPQGTSIPPFLSKYASEDYANIGTLSEPDYEQINALDPDLIIVAGRSSSVYPDLAKMAPTIDLTIDQDDFFESVKANAVTLGKIFGAEEEVEASIAQLEASVERVQTMAAENQSKALIVMVSGGEVSAYGPGSRFGLIHDLLGVAPVVEDVEEATHGDAISFEFIQEHNPDLMYVIDRDSAIGESGEAAAQVLDNELVHSTTAWTNDAITYLDSSTWYLANAGLNTFATMVSEIEGSLE